MVDKVALNKIVAVEKGARTRTEGRITEAYHRAQKGDTFSGVARTYKPKDDDGDKLPEENQKIVNNSKDVIELFAQAQEEFIDVIATKDYGNCDAVADVVVDGEVLLAGVPVSHLLFLEKRLNEIKAFVGKLPTLSPTEEWEFDENQGVWRSQVTTTTRTQKVPDVQVLYEATDKHPAQVQPFNRDVIVGYWDTVKFSSALPASTVNTFLERANKLQDAVKFAREQANMTEVDQRKVGGKLLSYIFS